MLLSVDQLVFIAVNCLICMFSGESRITSININLQNRSSLVELRPTTAAELSVCNNKCNDAEMKKKIPKNLI